MNYKDREILNYNNRFFKILAKSGLHTLVVFIVSIFLGNYTFALLFRSDDMAMIFSFFVAIIFRIFYCSFNLIEEIANIKESR